MMDHLGAKEGEEMKFEHVDLPKGQFVRLQPVSSAWLVSAIHVHVHVYNVKRIPVHTVYMYIHCMLHMYILYARQQPFLALIWVYTCI